MLTQYVDGKTSENFISTIGIEFKNKIIELENWRKIRLQIWDTSGQEKFKALTKNYFLVVMLLYLFLMLQTKIRLIILKIG